MERRHASSIGPARLWARSGHTWRSRRQGRSAHATPSAAPVRPITAAKNAGGWPLNRPDATKPRAAACAPALAGDEGRITHQCGRWWRRNSHGRGITRRDPRRPSVRFGFFDRPSLLLKPVIPSSDWRKTASRSNRAARKLRLLRANSPYCSQRSLPTSSAAARSFRAAMSLAAGRPLASLAAPGSAAPVQPARPGSPGSWRSRLTHPEPATGADRADAH